MRRARRAIASAPRSHLSGQRAILPASVSLPLRKSPDWQQPKQTACPSKGPASRDLPPGRENGLRSASQPGCQSESVAPASRFQRRATSALLARWEARAGKRFRRKCGIIACLCLSIQRGLRPDGAEWEAGRAGQTIKRYEPLIFIRPCGKCSPPRPDQGRAGRADARLH